MRFTLETDINKFLLTERDKNSNQSLILYPITYTMWFGKLIKSIEIRREIDSELKKE